MFLSIITPVYNSAEYLAACLDSCLDQGMSADDYEIICIDDGSVDDSAVILDEYITKHPNLIVVHKTNGGVSAARNIALDLAKGDYIWFIDSDDFIERNVLPDIHKLALEQKPEKINFNAYHMQSDYFTPEEEKLRQNNQLTPGTRLIWSAIYSAECIRKYHTRFHPELTSNEDLVFTYELRTSIGGYKHEVFYDRIVYFYRNNGGSITHMPPSRKLNSFIPLCAIMRDHALANHDGFAWYTMVRYLYFSFHGLSQLPAAERQKWLRLMREKKVYPSTVGEEGIRYYREHFSSMKVKGIPMALFRWIPTPLGYRYVMLRSSFSKLLRRLRGHKAR